MSASGVSELVGRLRPRGRGFTCRRDLSSCASLAARVGATLLRPVAVSYMHDIYVRRPFTSPDFVGRRIGVTLGDKTAQKTALGFHEKSSLEVATTALTQTT